MKNKIFGFLIFLLFVLPTLVFSTDLSACGTLSTSSAVYSLTGNIASGNTNPCLTITGTDITINGNNKVITGGILVSAARLTINNTIMVGGQGATDKTGIHIDAVNTTIINSLITNGTISATPAGCWVTNTGYKIYAIYVDSGGSLILNSTTISNFKGGTGSSGCGIGQSAGECKQGGRGGEGYAIYALNDLKINNSLIENISSGDAGGSNGCARYACDSSPELPSETSGAIKQDTGTVLFQNSKINNITRGTWAVVQCNGLSFDATGINSPPTYGLYTPKGNITNSIITSIISIRGGNAVGSRAGGNGGDAYGVGIVNSANNIISNMVIDNIVGGVGGSGTSNGANGSANGIYLNLANNTYIFNTSNSISQLNSSSQRFYSNTAQNISALYNLGWFPFYKNNGSVTTSQAATAFYNATSGFNADLSSNSSLTYWYQGLAPILSSASILPSPAFNTSTLLGYCNATTPDSANVSYNYTFFKNGALNTTGSVGPFTQGLSINVGNISSSFLTNGHNWTLQCQAYNVNGASMLNSSTTTIVVPPPTIISSIILPTPAYKANNLLGYCNASTVDGTNVSYNYTWFLNGAVNSNGSVGNFTQGFNTNIANISNSSLSIGQNWTLQCTAYNINGLSSPLNSSTASILPLPPSIYPSLSSVTAYNKTHISYNFSSFVINNVDSYTNANLSLWANNTLIGSKLINMTANSIDTSLSATWTVQRSRVDSNFSVMTKVTQNGMSANNSANLILPIYAG